VDKGVMVQFNGAGTDTDGNIVKYEWDFDGDGIYEWSSDENGRTTNIYNNAGTYEAFLKVTDDEGNTGTDSIAVIVPKDDTEDGVSTLPSISLISAFLMLGLIAIFRRK
jgi:PKD repeat protein